MKRKENILILGYLGFVTNQLDGQTIKTRSIYQLLEKNTAHSLDFFDTQTLHGNPLRIFQLVVKAAKARTVIMVPAHNNLKYFFSVLFILSRIFRFRILFIPVGGWLIEFLSDLPLHRKMLAKVEAIFPQTSLMKKQLEHDYGFRNVHVLPNFRHTTYEPPSSIRDDNTFRIVFFARINKRKGLDYMAHLANHIANTYPLGSVVIDFYGPIHEPSEAFFRNELLQHKFVAYKGVLEPSLVHETLGQYDVLVLPTHYYTEGFPGSILDAYIASIPVIATQWKHANEFIDDQKNGFIIPFENSDRDLCDRIDYLYNHPHQLIEMKAEAALKASSFSPQAAYAVLAPFLPK